MCGREIQNSIEDSVLSLLADRINYYGLGSYYDVQKSTIYAPHGGQFLFKGLKGTTVDSIKSMHGITDVWLEEAQAISKRSLDILLPTVLRNKNNGEDAKIIYTYNPTKETDAVYERFNKEITPSKSLVFEVSWRQNKYFTDAMREEMEFNFKHDPETAMHIWEGKLCPTPNGMAVIPLAWLKKCVDAHKMMNIEVKGFEYLGFDIADTGQDHCALAYRIGSLLKDVKEFDNQFISQSVDFVHNYTLDKSIVRVHYDASGLGAGAKSDFNRINKKYMVEPFLGAARPKGDDKKYLDDITNAQYFRNLKAQAWWAIRIRVENTLRLIDGDDISPEKCLFIDGNINNLNKLLLELSQASYKHEDGKLMVDKQPNDEASPNMADAVVISYAHDIKNGLRAR